MRPDTRGGGDTRGRHGTRARRDVRAKSDTTVGPDTDARPADRSSQRHQTGVRGRDALSSSPCRPSGHRGRGKTGGGAPDSPPPRGVGMVSWKSFLESNQGEEVVRPGTPVPTNTNTRRRTDERNRQQPLPPGERERGRNASNHLKESRPFTPHHATPLRPPPMRAQDPLDHTTNPRRNWL